MKSIFLRPTRSVRPGWPLLAVFAFTLVCASAGAQTASEKILYSFNPQPRDGFSPYGNVIGDDAGNLYGTTSAGGANSVGSVYELSPGWGGGWTEKVLYSFANNGSDGYDPQAGLILDKHGNLYGTTANGGTSGCGTVFELLRDARGSWTEKMLHSFNCTNGASNGDGINPLAGLTFDSKGNLYGTTLAGGADGLGTVFELSPPTESGGAWAETILHSFPGNGNDGYLLYGGVIFDSEGNLYGTAFLGGADGLGMVFELSPPAVSGGAWTETDLCDFNFENGLNPEPGLVFDTNGNLYGTTYLGGPPPSSIGVVFELSPSGNGSWSETVIHSFTSGAGDGIFPTNASLIIDGDGNLYGTTPSGGVNDQGVVFELSPEAGGSWMETVLHTFSATATDGTIPKGALFMDKAGNLYGTVTDNGAGYVGGVYELSESSGAWNEKLVHSFNSRGEDGQTPTAGLTFDWRGNLYGTTSLSGSEGFGTVYELSPDWSGSWTEKTLLNFDNQDGAFSVAGLTFDNWGNLYGTTENGGTNYGYGNVFELSPDARESWTENVLTDFGPGSGPSDPGFGSLVRDSRGNLYGTTIDGGTYGWGTVFELSPNWRGGWTQTILHNFEGNSSDSGGPVAGLTLDAYGNLYGTTLGANRFADGSLLNGSNVASSGTVFELSPDGSGGWTEKTLYAFAGFPDGQLPYSGVTFDAHGNLYGTTQQGGASGAGTVYELSPNGSGGWTEMVLYSFTYVNGDGEQPNSGVTFDAHGNLYGTTGYGGTNYLGTVFELSPPAESGGAWTETVLHSFGSSLTDGRSPYAGVVIDRQGNLYGTTQQGGTGNAGTVFEIIP